MLRPLLELRMQLLREKMLHEPIVISSDDEIYENGEEDEPASDSDDGEEPDAYDLNDSFINDTDYPSSSEEEEEYSSTSEDETRSAYEILGVHRNVRKDELKRAYRQLCLKWHPDKNQSAIAEDKMKQITEAYRTITEEKNWK